jgi:hypothetical protein
MVTRQQRVDGFGSDGEVPAGEPLELLCEDHNGTYVLELRLRNAAAQMRMVSVARIRLDPPKSTQLFKGIICDDILSSNLTCPATQSVSRHRC